jgi:proteasome lid subunit RPN8/RPN11
MLQGLIGRAAQLVREVQRSLLRPVPPVRTAPAPSAAAAPTTLEPLQRALLTDGVARTLFEEYAEHRSSASGDEETGWVLLGLRHGNEAVVLATLPAGTRSDASVSHVRFNSLAQAVASRIVRQTDRRLTILGVVHTHPGTLRHPSDGDLRGDRDWVGRLRGKEGIFGIGTADAVAASGAQFAYQPRPNVQCLGDARFSWYALAEGERDYRPLPVELTIGPDLARSLHIFWPTLEAHAERIERLYRQQAGLRFEVTADEWGPGLILTLPLAESGDSLRVVVRPKGVRYYVVQEGQVFEVQHQDEHLDRGVYLLLAELAARA